MKRHRQRIRDHADLRLRICVRLEWLGLTKSAFSDAIGLHKASFSRFLRADSPRDGTVRLVAKGLGMTQEELMGDVENLLMEHPAIHPLMSLEDRVAAIRNWVRR